MNRTQQNAENYSLWNWKNVNKEVGENRRCGADLRRKLSKKLCLYTTGREVCTYFQYRSNKFSCSPNGGNGMANSPSSFAGCARMVGDRGGQTLAFGNFQMPPSLLPSIRS